MGAWGFGVFDNDDSCDFIMKLSEQDNIEESIKTVLENIINEKKFIELDLCCSAWVSVCIIDQIINGLEYECPDIQYDDIIERVEKDKIMVVKNIAVSAINCILSDISELRELIEECEENDYKIWYNSLSDIKKRLEVKC
jgi:hypothetical protein